MQRDVPLTAFLPSAPGSDRELIIEVFARRQPAYTRPDALRLLRLSEGEFERELASLVFGPEQNDRGMTVYRWEDLAHLALERWTPRMIEAALRIKAWEAIPHLNQHRLVQVSLPIYLIRYLDYCARQESANRLPRNASDIMERILHEHAEAEHDLHRLDLEIHGFREALRYPYYTPRAGSILHRCRYCDISITEAAREVCKPCSARHEPKEHLGEYGIPDLEEPEEPSPPRVTPPPRKRQARRRGRK